MSLPGMGWPSSALGAVVVFLAIFVFISCSGWRAAGRIKKPTTVASRGLLSKFASTATNPPGVAVSYDDNARSPDLQHNY